MSTARTPLRSRSVTRLRASISQGIRGRDGSVEDARLSRPPRRVDKDASADSPRHPSRRDVRHLVRPRRTRTPVYSLHLGDPGPSALCLPRLEPGDGIQKLVRVQIAPRPGCRRGRDLRIESVSGSIPRSFRLRSGCSLGSGAIQGENFQLEVLPRFLSSGRVRATQRDPERPAPRPARLWVNVHFGRGDGSLRSGLIKVLQCATTTSSTLYITGAEFILWIFTQQVTEDRRTIYKRSN